MGEDGTLVERLREGLPCSGKSIKRVDRKDAECLFDRAADVLEAKDAEIAELRQLQSEYLDTPVGRWIARAEAAERAFAAAQAEIAGLRDALKPFAAVASLPGICSPDETVISYAGCLTLGDARRARAALAHSEP